MSEIELIEIFADNLRDKMIEVGVGQNELAREINVGKSTISRYLSKERMPTLKVLLNICYVLECELEDLVPTYDIIE